MTRIPLVLAMLASLNALAWSSSTAWQWDETGRTGKYAAAQTADGSNAAALGPLASLARVGTASGVETLEARCFGFATLTGLVLEKYGMALIFR